MNADEAREQSKRMSDYRDDQQYELIKELISKQVHKGEQYLSHDGDGNSLDIRPNVVKRLSEEGYNVASTRNRITWY